jgi:hypothetical protein
MDSLSFYKRMDATWPFVVLTLGLFVGLCFTIASLERTGVMNRWTDRRCDLAVMVAAPFFKPDTDPRTSTKFATDNFEFCMKTYVDRFMEVFSAPLNAVLGKQVNLAEGASGMMNSIRNIAQTLYNTFSSYMEEYFNKFKASVFEMSRIVQYLKMAMDRMNGIIMTMVYSGITMFRGMVNAIQFIIKIILFICVIMLIIIIILFFILFPVMPIIMTTLGAIIITVVAMASVMSGSLAADAEDKKKGFCFSGDTLLSVWREEVVQHVPIKDVRVGDELQGANHTRVTAVIHMDGEGVELYDLLGVTISESHLVKGTDGVWKSVGQDERAIKTEKRERILYCLNTTTRIIPVRASDGSLLSFRDWEEIEDDDEVGQYGWNELILSLLNSGRDASHSQSTDARMPTDIPLMAPELLVKTRVGFLPVSFFTIPREGSRVSFGWVLDRHGNEQRVLGFIRGEVEEYELDELDNHLWNTELYEEHDGVWIKGTTTGLKPTTGHTGLQGIHLITETGEWILWDEKEKKEKIIRDFTEVGYDSIHNTYPFVSSRLRPADNLQDPK